MIILIMLIMTMNVSPAIQKSYVFREFRSEMDPALRLTPCPKWELSNCL